MDKNLDVSNVNIRRGYWAWIENKFTSEDERKKIMIVLQANIYFSPNTQIFF